MIHGFKNKILLNRVLKSFAQKGLGLIELMASLLIGMIVAVGMFSLINVSQATSSSMSAISDFQTLMFTLTEIAKSPSLCETSFLNSSATAVAPSNVSGNSALYLATINLPGTPESVTDATNFRGLHIESLDIISIGNNFPDPNPNFAGNVIYTLQLNIVASPRKDVSGGTMAVGVANNSLVGRVTFVASLDTATRQIERCVRSQQTPPT